jgi:hypothetical protein
MGEWSRDELAELRALLNDARVVAAIGGQDTSGAERIVCDDTERAKLLRFAQTAEEYAEHLRRQASALAEQEARPCWVKVSEADTRAT